METESWYKQGYTDAYYGKDYSDRVPKERIGSYKEGQYRFWEEYYLNLSRINTQGGATECQE